MDINEAATKALEMPSDFFTSDDNIGASHALTIAVHRDSDTIERSNWEVIKEDMTSRFPEDVYVHGASHWAVGWIDQLAVRVYLYVPFVGRVVSPAFHAIMEWKDNLEEYPLADESAYSEMEYEEAIETLINSYHVSKEKATEAFSYLFDTYSYSSADEYNDDAVAEAMAAIGDNCQNCGFHKAKRVHTKQIAYGTLKQALCVSCYIQTTTKL